MSVELPEPTILVGETDAVTSTGAARVRDTVPAKPFNPVTVIVEVPDKPATNVREKGLAVMLKSTTFTVTAAECTSELLVPVTSTA